MGKKERPQASWESEIRLKDIIDFLPDATFVIDDRKRISIWNRAMEEMTGVASGAMIGKGDFEYAIPFFGERRPILIDMVDETPETIASYYPNFKKIGGSVIAESFIPKMKGDGAVLWGIAKPLYDHDGRMIGAIESLRDITEMKRSEETIQKQKKELQSTIFKLMKANREYEEANTTLEEAQMELEFANTRLGQSEEKFAAAFRLSPVALALSTAAEGRYVEVSESFYAASGYTKEELIGRTALELNIWADSSDRDRVVAKLMEQERIINEEVLFRDKSGAVHNYYLSAEILTIAGTRYMLSLNIDVTERKRAEETIRRQKEELEAINRELTGTIFKKEETNERLSKARQDLEVANELLRQSEEKFSKAFHMGPIIITLSSMESGCYVEVSDYFIKMTEYSREEIIGRSSVDLDHWVDPGDYERIMKEIGETGAVRDRELRFRSRTGKTYMMLYSAEIIAIHDSPHLVSIAVDITERRKAEEENDRLEKQLVQAQKLESIGRLAGGLAHDFNNLLTAILGNVQLAMLDIEEDTPLFANLASAKEAAESAAGLTRQLLAFSRKQIIEPEIIDLNDMIGRMSKMLVRLIGEDVRLLTSYHAESPRIKADPGQIEQIVINLAINARDAMPAGGTLILEAGEASLDEDYCRSRPYVQPGEYAVISVSDDGTGMTDTVKIHIFEPFFTTKPKGKGTGLGLAMVYGAVKQNKGNIEVYSVPGEGTTFKIYLPLVRGEATASAIKRTADDLPGGSETILLVEDDPLVRDFAAGTLRRLGYRVLEARSGEEAIPVFESSKGAIDLLLTDVILPVMNGRDLAANLATRKPGLKILFTSGYTEDIIAQHNILEKGIHFIGKPYSIHAISTKIRTILDGDS